jgi:hypothetical protein
MQDKPKSVTVAHAIEHSMCLLASKLENMQPGESVASIITAHANDAAQVVVLELEAFGVEFQSQPSALDASRIVA